MENTFIYPYLLVIQTNIMSPPYGSDNGGSTFASLFSVQAEELNTIVGNAFKMAYAAQRERDLPSLGGSFDVSSDDPGDTSQSCPESPEVHTPLPSTQPTFNQIIGKKKIGLDNCTVSLAVVTYL